MSARQGGPMRVLGILTGSTVDAVVEGELRGCGALEELLDLPESKAQVGLFGEECTSLAA